MPYIVIRCDASMAIGSGHVMRCAALAAVLREKGATVDFVSRDLSVLMRNRIAAISGAKVHVLSGRSRQTAADEEAGPVLRHRDWLPVTQAADAADTLQIMRSGPRPDWLVVDHYALDVRWEQVLRPHVDRIFAIDDLSDRDHDCDILLDQNFFLKPARRYAGRIPRGTHLLLGPRFALLRPEFGAARERLPKRSGALRRLFVTFGSYDPTNQTALALRAIDAAGLDGVITDVVIGQDNPHLAEIETYCRARPHYRLHIDPVNMAALIATADLAIGASGATNWERCCLRLPTILISVAENQCPIARDLAEQRACIYLGRNDEVSEDAITTALRELAASPSLAHGIGTKAGELVDGRGTRRVADRLLPQSIRIRKAQDSDCAPMHAWRNAEETRRFAFQPDPITFEDHVRWFEQTIRDPNVALLIGDRADRPVGVLRYDFRGEVTKVSVYLVPGMQGQGLGTALLVAGTGWLRSRYPNIRRIIAEIKPDNLTSVGAFANAGFSPGGDDFVLDLENEKRD